ncbi:hypothetical protein ACFV4Q_26070 [Streptomyces nojiriensis]|uniref:hypothetical protein n=1 Tax=Streptomyces nojiriensis TaxID=66374 RepID=UPI003651406E
MLSPRRAARLASSQPPVPQAVEPSRDRRDYLDHSEKPPLWVDANDEEELAMWRMVRANRRMLTACRLWAAQNGRPGKGA